MRRDGRGAQSAFDKPVQLPTGLRRGVENRLERPVIEGDGLFTRRHRNRRRFEVVAPPPQKLPIVGIHDWTGVGRGKCRMVCDDCKSPSRPDRASGRRKYLQIGEMLEHQNCVRDVHRTRAEPIQLRQPTPHNRSCVPRLGKEHGRNVVADNSAGHRSHYLALATTQVDNDTGGIADEFRCERKDVQSINGIIGDLVKPPFCVIKPFSQPGLL